MLMLSTKNGPSMQNCLETFGGAETFSAPPIWVSASSSVPPFSGEPKTFRWPLPFRCGHPSRPVCYRSAIITTRSSTGVFSPGHSHATGPCVEVRDRTTAPGPSGERAAGREHDADRSEWAGQGGLVHDDLKRVDLHEADIIDDISR